MATVAAMRFSVLDRGAAGPLDQVAEHARHVEKLGFQRFLVAEHHGVPGIPAGQPGMLAAHVAAHTQRIRGYGRHYVVKSPAVSGGRAD